MDFLEKLNKTKIVKYIVLGIRVFVALFAATLIVMGVLEFKKIGDPKRYPVFKFPLKPLKGEVVEEEFDVSFSDRYAIEYYVERNLSQRELSYLVTGYYPFKKAGEAELSEDEIKSVSLKYSIYDKEGVMVSDGRYSGKKKESLVDHFLIYRLEILKGKKYKLKVEMLNDIKKLIPCFPYIKIRRTHATSDGESAVFFMKGLMLFIIGLILCMCLWIFRSKKC